MIVLPEELTVLLTTLTDAGIRPIIVGGYVRDALLGTQSSDIDIELYHLSNFEELENLLSRFGKVNLVGKSFGVLKLKMGRYTLDFSPPRSESKSGFGHKGFEVETYQDLDFKSASRRRDFTINAIGYDPSNHTLLDPHGGISDLHNKRLRYVDAESFGEDPLRVLRGVQFCARFELTCNDNLMNLCRDMITKGALEELPKERIFEEIKKLFLLSQKPSIGLKMLEQMGGKHLLFPSDEGWERGCERCDQTALTKTANESHDLPLLFASLFLELPNPETVLEKIVFQHSLISATLKIIHHTHRFGTFGFPPPPLVMGRDLVSLGLTPSEEFSTLLDQAYVAQMEGHFTTHDQAIQWCQEHLVTVL